MSLWRRWLHLGGLWLRRLCIVAALCCVPGLCAGAVLWHTFPFPRSRLDNWPVNPLVTDRTGQTLLEVVGADDQWRQPVPLEDISPWLAQALIAAEDERFHSHHGIDPLAVTRAITQNLRHARVVSGASTLSMQVCRMIDDRPRTFSAKAIEAFRALQLERQMTKPQILEAYLNIAPMGGNIRGVEAASRRYFNKHAKDLSLGEAALLAGLPQSPSRYRPDRHPDWAIWRRRYVLRRMLALGFITETQRQAASDEPVIVSKSVVVHQAPHAAWLALASRPTGGVTTIDLSVQTLAEQAAFRPRANWPEGTDVSVVILDVATGDLLALVGSADVTDPRDGQVNGVTALRSPGSALKPFLYAAAFEARRLAPDSVIADSPIVRAGWSPDNFDETFAGEVTAADALRRSLNVPAIRVTESLGLIRCLGTLEACGVRLPRQSAQRGGLAVAVGAVEVSLLDLTNAYATLARGGNHKPTRLFLEDAITEPRPALGADACAAVNDILSSHRRPPNGLEETLPESRPWFMWKTGTSSGRRDAWAVGHNGRYAVGVWVGQFSGAGAPQYVGREAAEPILAEILSDKRLRAAAPAIKGKSWLVTHPLFAESHPAPARWIEQPQEGDTFVATGATAIVHPVIAHVSGGQVFVDGQCQITTPSRLNLAPGKHEIRVLDQQGQSQAVRFLVETKP